MRDESFELDLGVEAATRELTTGLQLHGDAQPMSETEINNFLSQFSYVPMSEQRAFIQWSDEFPLIFNSLPVEKAMEAWLSRLQPNVAKSPTKENQPLLMISAPTGAGKTTFLCLVCQLFKTRWIIEDFMRSILSHDEEEPSEHKATWLKKLRQAIENIKTGNRMRTLIASGMLAQSFLTSTHACFISFNSTSPITSFEIQQLGCSSERMLIARIIFSQLPASDSPWPIDYERFLRQHGNALRKLPLSLHQVVKFFRETFSCDHFLLAIDELVLIDNVDNNASGVRQVLTMVGKVIMTDPQCAAIVSSLVTGPLSDYVVRSQHEPVFIPLNPYLEDLPDLADIIIGKRGDPESYHPVTRMLFSTGGHPKLLYKMIPWLLNPHLSCDEMSLSNAVMKCSDGIDNSCLHEPDIARAILIGGPASPELIARLSGLGGMLPQAWQAPLSL